MPITFEPPANREIAEELTPVRASMLRRVIRQRTIKRVSVSTAVAAALSVGGVSVAVGINQDYFANSEFHTKPQYVDQFADCMEARGWEPLPGSNDPQTPGNVPAVHFLYPAEASANISRDAGECRDTISARVGESIIPDM
ncbi:hypothetical protein ABIB35_000620 [Arthrobacter sp. UYP6]|uniref:hypothetical protein n=1 Tax=Arthrobacter sp. UYP6 TaxID=1756378 RepID=UPI00339931C4